MASGSDRSLKTCLSISGQTSSLQDVISTVIFFASPFPLACLQKALSHSLRLSKLSKLEQCLWFLFWSLIRKDWQLGGVWWSAPQMVTSGWSPERPSSSWSGGRRPSHGSHSSAQRLCCQRTKHLTYLLLKVISVQGCCVSICFAFEADF